tara:strand:- start:3780 stop:3935 length:156 start_codon:yes stop_codon:yes gene_type:complete
MRYTQSSVDRVREADIVKSIGEFYITNKSEFIPRKNINEYHKKINRCLELK